MEFLCLKLNVSVKGFKRYLNKLLLAGLAFTGLQNKKLYPVITSTSARSGMKLIASHCFPAGLQFLCYRSIVQNTCNKLKIKPDDIPLPPGIKIFAQNNYLPFMKSINVFTEDQVMNGLHNTPKWQNKRSHTDAFGGDNSDSSVESNREYLDAYLRRFRMQRMARIASSEFATVRSMALWDEIKDKDDELREKEPRSLVTQCKSYLQKFAEDSSSSNEKGILDLEEKSTSSTDDPPSWFLRQFPNSWWKNEEQNKVELFDRPLSPNLFENFTENKVESNETKLNADEKIIRSHFKNKGTFSIRF